MPKVGKRSFLRENHALVKYVLVCGSAVRDYLAGYIWGWMLSDGKLGKGFEVGREKSVNWAGIEEDERFSAMIRY